MKLWIKMNALQLRITALVIASMIAFTTLNRSHRSLVLYGQVEDNGLGGIRVATTHSAAETDAYRVVSTHLAAITISDHKLTIKNDTAEDNELRKPVADSHAAAEPRHVGTYVENKIRGSILMASFVFGEEAASKKHLRMFIESVRYAGIDVAIVGDHRPPYDLPPNVRHVSITWDGLVDRISEKIFAEEEPGDLRKATFYKIVDIKPLFAFLFPDEVDGYDFWGHVDNNLILGDARRFLTKKVLEESDIICPIGTYKAWGPFMLYRNSKKTNELFRLAERPLEEIFATKITVAFSEWGHSAPGEFGDFYNSSMAGIVDHHAEALGLRWRAGGLAGIVWDGNCRQTPRQCAECSFRRGSLISKGREELNKAEVLLCHYQYETPFLESLLADQNTLDRLLSFGEFEVGFPQVFEHTQISDHSVDSTPQTNLTTIGTSVRSKNGSILMASYVFGEEAAKKKYLRMFIESARYSGIDVAIVGDPHPPYELPPNVRHVAITWDILVDRVYQRVFDGKETGNLRSATPYKIVDMKPLFAYLFPDEVDGYDFWGYLDNDLLVGHVPRFLTEEVLEQNDIICPIGTYKAWGPFMLYRNSKQSNELFRLADRPLKEIFATSTTVSFSEWGQKATKAGLGDFYNSSMAGIVDHHADRLGLRWRAGGLAGVVWDGNCRDNPGQCAECSFHQGSLTISKTRRGQRIKEEVLMCHYQYEKPFLESLLADQNTLDRLLNSGEFEVNFPRPINSTVQTRPPSVDTLFEHNPPRIFVCITGQIQRLILKKQIATLLDPLKNAGFGVDVALVASEGESRFTNKPGDNQTSPVPEWTSFHDAIKFLRNQGFRVLTDSPTNTTLSPVIPVQYFKQLNKEHFTLKAKQERVQNHARQFETLTKCHDAMITATNSRDHDHLPYDLILRVREDVAFEPPLNVSGLLPVLALYNNSGTILTSDCRTWGGINDRLAVVTPDTALSYFQGPYERFVNDNDNNETLKGVFNPETYLYDTYTKLNANVLTTRALRHIIKYQTNSVGEAVQPESELETECPEDGKRPWVSPPRKTTTH